MASHIASACCGKRCGFLENGRIQCGEGRRRAKSDLDILRQHLFKISTKLSPILSHSAKQFIAAVGCYDPAAHMRQVFTRHVCEQRRQIPCHVLAETQRRLLTQQISFAFFTPFFTVHSQARRTFRTSRAQTRR